MNLLKHTDLLRIKANSKLDPKGKSKLGQYFTPSPISLYMASLFNEIKGDIVLMDPGCGPGSLTAAFTDEAIYRRLAKAIEIDCYDIESVIEPFINETLRNCEVEISKYGIECKTTFNREDFILNNSNSLFDSGIQKKYTHVIMNPIIDKYEDFLQLIQSKIKDQMIGQEILLKTILGKSIRRISAERIKDFENEFIQQIKAGDINYIKLKQEKSNVTYVILKMPDFMFLPW